MTIEQRIKAALDTWYGWVALLTGFLGAVAGATMALRRCVGILNAVYRAGVFLLDLEDQLGKMRGQLERLEEGQQNLIGVRRGIMEEDEVRAWFEMSADGRFTVANKLWRDMTGMEPDDVIGHGWAAGIVNEEREALVRLWNDAVTHHRVFESRATLINRNTGKETPVRLAFWPIRLENGKLLSFLGRATVDKRKA